MATFSCTESELIRINPDMLVHQGSYSQIVRVESGKLLFLSGQVALDSNGKTHGDNFTNQLDYSLKNVHHALEAAGSSWRNVVNMRIYVVGLKAEHRILIKMALKEIYSSGNPPSNTLLGIQSLARKDLLVEIEVIAVAN